MDEVEIYSFDNKDYVLVTKIDSYLYLSNEKDPRDTAWPVHRRRGRLRGGGLRRLGDVTASGAAMVT